MRTIYHMFAGMRSAVRVRARCFHFPHRLWGVHNFQDKFLRDKESVAPAVVQARVIEISPNLDGI